MSRSRSPPTLSRVRVIAALSVPQGSKDMLRGLEGGSDRSRADWTPSVRLQNSVDERAESNVHYVYNTIEAHDLSMKR